MYSSSHYRFNILFENKNASIYMQLFTPFFCTSYLKDTYKLLEKYHPGVLKTKCYNNNNLPFKKEVAATELGHLFEHILLENLCCEKINAGFKTAIFSGRTFWDWENNPRGSFKISVDIKKKDMVFLPAALFNSVKMFNLVLGIKIEEELSFVNLLSDKFSYGQRVQSSTHSFKI